MSYENFVVIVTLHKEQNERSFVIDATRWRELLRVLEKRQRSLFSDFYNLTKAFLKGKDINFWIKNGFFKEAFER